jgi:hypothetical protein
MSAQTLNIFAIAATVFGSCLGIRGALMQANAYYPSCDVGGRFCSGRPFFGGQPFAPSSTKLSHHRKLEVSTAWGKTLV